MGRGGAAQVAEDELDLARRELTLSAAQVERLDDSTELGQHLDSIQLLQLVVAIEDHFEICFEPEDDDESTTLSEVVRIIEQRLAAR